MEKFYDFILYFDKNIMFPALQFSFQYPVEARAVFIGIFFAIISMASMTTNLGLPFYFGIHFIAYGGFISSVLLVLGIWKKDEKLLIPWIFAQAFGTLESIFMLIITSNFCLLYFIAIEMACLYIILFLYVKFSSPPDSSLNYSVSYIDFKHGLLNPHSPYFKNSSSYPPKTRYPQRSRYNVKF